MINRRIEAFCTGYLSSSVPGTCRMIFLEAFSNPIVGFRCIIEEMGPIYLGVCRQCHPSMLAYHFESTLSLNGPVIPRDVLIANWGMRPIEYTMDIESYSLTHIWSMIVCVNGSVPETVVPGGPGGGGGTIWRRCSQSTEPSGV
jgi:hypothetical protein